MSIEIILNMYKGPLGFHCVEALINEAYHNVKTLIGHGALFWLSLQIVSSRSLSTVYCYCQQNMWLWEIKVSAWLIRNNIQISNSFPMPTKFEMADKW